MAVTALSGPKKIIELDGKPQESWRLDPKALHLWNGKLWKLEAHGCLLCAQDELEGRVTFSHQDDSDEEHYWCMRHGALTEVSYSMVKNYTVTIGGVTRSGEESIEDVMLFPSSMSAAEQNKIIEGLLDETEAEEKESGAAPDLDDDSDDDC
jgi:hypothetical protein